MPLEVTNVNRTIPDEEHDEARLVEARSQIYIFLKHVLEEDIAESYVYQNWA